MKKILCILLALLLCLAAGCGVPQQPAPAQSDAGESAGTVALPSGSELPQEQPAEPEPLRMTQQTVRTAYSENIDYISWWGSHDGRIWACGLDKSGSYTPTVVSMLPDGSGVEQLIPIIQPAGELAEQQAQLAAEDPDSEYHLGYDFRALLWNSAGEMLPVLGETLSRRASTGAVQQMGSRYSVCMLDADGLLQRGAALQLPEEITESGLLYTFIGFLLAGDDDVWCFASAFDAAQMQYTGNLCLRFSLADGSCTARLTLPDGYPAMYHHVLADGSLLLRCGSGSVCDMYILRDAAGDAPQLSEPLPMTVKDGTEPPYSFMHLIADGPQTELLSATPTGICQYDPESGAVEYLLLWKDYGIDGRLFCINPFFVLSERQLLVVEYTELQLLTLE